MPATTRNLFDPISGDLLPACREEYVQGRLNPELTQLVENYLKSSPIQANIVLGRAQALMATAQDEERSFTPPLWVQEQLRYQPTVSAAGPLRRPVVRLVLGLFLLLIVASIVQWLRNEPLVPAPVARVVVQVANSATQATRHLVQRLIAPSAPAPAVVASVVASKPIVHLSQSPAHQPAPPVPIQAQVSHVVEVKLQPADSLATKPLASPAAPVAATNTLSTVRGRIMDSQGQPLPGATVMVQGTGQASSTNANGDYLLTVPVGSTLQFGYAGYADQLQRYSGASTVDIMLLQNNATAGSRRRR